MSRQIMLHRSLVIGAEKPRQIIWQTLPFYLTNHKKYSYHDQVPEEEVPFVRREPDYKSAYTLRCFTRRVFIEPSSITGKKGGKIGVERGILRPATMSRYT